ncbi:MAG: hypothetical protein QOK43_2417 [Acidimicrobiaceae bacterium]|jgi:plastocyanin|nr:hypothetical protein [Acidimicrobiaceae bacterium]MDQ1444555.1 hypothetical protein [Acidimicrobiaceae bacterium]
MAARRLAVAVALTAVLFGGSPARATAPPAAVVAVEQYRYIPGDTTGSVPVSTTAIVHVSQGGKLFLANVDPSAPHTLTGPEVSFGVYLFDTPYEVGTGDMAQVGGVDKLKPGTYPFMCRLHTNLMRGQLVVEPA